MSTASALSTVGTRKIGLRARDWNGPPLHPGVKKEPPAARQPTPEEDILRPPEDSSNDDAPDSDFGDAPPLKKRKTKDSEDSVTIESIPRQRSSKTSSAWGPLPNAPSDIKATTWRSSQRNAGDTDEDEDFFSLSQNLPRRKSRNTYIKRPNTNIHAAESKREKTLASPAKTHQDALGFMVRDTTDLESRCMDPFSLIRKKIDKCELLSI